jgi:hypothetical protein
MIQLFILHPCPFFGAPFAVNWDSPADLPPLRGACHVRCTCCSQKRLFRQPDYSAREASIETKRIHINSITCSLQQTTISLLSKRVEAFHEVFEKEFLTVHSPGMRKYSIAGDMVIVRLHQTEIPGPLIYKKAHYCGRLLQVQKSGVVGTQEQSN